MEKKKNLALTGIRTQAPPSSSLQVNIHIVTAIN
jgi:hypothetical protein